MAPGINFLNFTCYPFLATAAAGRSTDHNIADEECVQVITDAVTETLFFVWHGARVKSPQNAGRRNFVERASHRRKSQR
jgi:hypothetical protein